MRILLVGDDPISTLVLRRFLTYWKHETVVVTDGEQALAVLAERPIDVIVSDWVMALVDGLELCQKVREKTDRDYCYFIMVTAKTLPEERDLAFRAGVDDFLRKPLDPAELAGRLAVAERILEMQRNLQQKGQELTQMAEMLRMQNQRVNNLFKGLPIPCVTIDDTGRIMEWNRSAEQLFQQKAYEVWGKPLAQAMTLPRQQQFVRRVVEESLSGKLIENYAWKFPLADCRRLRLIVCAFPIFGPNNDQVGSVFAFVDTTRQEELAQRVREQLKVQKELSAKLELLATTDGLTGLHNNRTFKSRLLEEIASARKTGQPLSLILADVDKFKLVNDDFGHLVGDEVLRKVAAVFKSVMGSFDRVLAARYGGEEFVLLAPGYTPEEALALAETTRTRVMKENWPHRPVTASFGVATWHADLPDYEAFIEQSDQALYYCKLNGRNCSHHFSDIPPEALEAA